LTSRRHKSNLKPVSAILGDALRVSGLGDRLTERTPLMKWPDIVGPEIAQQVRAVDLDDGRLILEADHGAWRQELTMLIPEIINKFNALFGEGTVTDIQWRGRPGQGRKRSGRK